MISAAYVFGSSNGAIITSKVLNRTDIRDYGSGNPGLTNYFRIYGKKGSLLVILIDSIKTIIPVITGGLLFSHLFDPSSLFIGQLITGLFVILGHCYPLFHRFKGGKGVMTVGTILLILDWRVALISWGIFILLTLLTGYVSLGAIIGVTAFPIAVYTFDLGGILAIIIAAMYALLLIYKHIPNIIRLAGGIESKITFY